MQVFDHQSLAPYTSFHVGGDAERLHIAETLSDLTDHLPELKNLSGVLGYGCNVLISDAGLPGETLLLRNRLITVNGHELIAEAGAWWDEAVVTAIDHGLWGLELMSEIPSSVGGAIYGNIAAYGQQVSDTLSWLETYSRTTGEVTRYSAEEFTFGYRSSSLQQHPEHIILRAGFMLSDSPLHDLRYDSALAVAEELGTDHTTLAGRRASIIETRRRAGSLYHPDDPSAEHSAGSFFKNPLVSIAQARELARFDESGKTLERIENQSRIHGGDSHRASAAHVLLAAGFRRGQRWGAVALHPKHVLKIITEDGATAAQVYAVMNEIIDTVHTRLGIALEPEVKLLGKF